MMGESHCRDRPDVGSPRGSTASLTGALLPQTVTPDYPDVLPRPMETSPTAASVNMPPVEDA
jgi:hypothetical protein